MECASETETESEREWERERGRIIQRDKQIYQRIFVFCFAFIFAVIFVKISEWNNLRSFGVGLVDTSSSLQCKLDDKPVRSGIIQTGSVPEVLALNKDLTTAQHKI